MSGTGTAILWELAGKDNNLPFLIPLLKKHKEQVTEKHCTTGQTLLHCACSYGNREVVLHLMNMEAVSLEAQDNLYGYTALHFACFYDKQPIIEEILKLDEEKAEKVFNIADKLGWNCLHHAAKNGNHAIAKILIEHSCDVNAKDKKGKIPVHIAAENGHKELLPLLFNHSPLNCFMLPMADKNGFTALHYAAMGGHQQCVEWLRGKQFSPLQPRDVCVVLDHGKEETPINVQSVDEVAHLFGQGGIAGQLKRYKANFESWVKDIQELEQLTQVKLCICGDPEVGKTALMEALKKSVALLSFLNPDIEEHNDDPTRKSKGIEVQQLDLPNKVSYQVWDFAGQVESFITHHFFISTDNTVIVMMVNLKTSIEETRQQMLRWLSFVKLRNTGATRYHFSAQAEDLVDFGLPELKSDDASSLQKVPVLVVASHLDQVDSQKEVPKVQQLLGEVKELFSSSLDIHPTLFSLNCLNSRSTELSSVKDHLGKLHSSTDHLQRKYPRIVRLVEECIMREKRNKNVKLIQFSELYKLVHDEVNGLLSQNQLVYICKVLSNTGKIVYNDKGAQARYLCVDPSWLCRDILGTALAPSEFDAPNLANQFGKSVISEDELTKLLGVHADPHLDTLIQLLCSFELCHKLKATDPPCYEFPCFITEPLQPSAWLPDPKFVYYHGRRIQCSEEIDSLPPGLFNRLQVKLCSIYAEASMILMFKNAFIMKDKNAECLVVTDELNNHVTFIARTSEDNKTHASAGKASTNAQDCLLPVDLFHRELYKLLKAGCPNIRMKWHFLSPMDLKAHKDEPYVYQYEDVINTIYSKIPFFNKVAGQAEEALDVLYCGSKQAEEEWSGPNMPLAFLPDFAIEGLEELLGDTNEPKNWTDLCEKLGMGDYKLLFMDREPRSTEALLRKYGENPKWRVKGLISALHDLGRLDVLRWLQTRLGIYKRKTNTL